MKVTEIKGDLIKLAQQGEFDVIVQGNNYFCVQGAGLAPQMVKAFGTDKFPMERDLYKGDINKLGCIDFRAIRRVHDRKNESSYFGSFNSIYVKSFEENEKVLYVVNAYTQYGFGRNHSNGTENPVDYDAVTMVMRKINHEFKGKHIGLPRIGAGLAGGDWNKIKGIILRELTDCDVTLVEYKK